MLTVKNENLDLEWHNGRHPALRTDYQSNSHNRGEMAAMALCKEWDFRPVDTDKQYWQNDGSTLVLGMTTIAEPDLLVNANEWLDDMLLDAMKIAAYLKADEFDFEKVDEVGSDHIAYVIRFWWD